MNDNMPPFIRKILISHVASSVAAPILTGGEMTPEVQESLEKSFGTKLAPRIVELLSPIPEEA